MNVKFLHVTHVFLHSTDIDRAPTTSLTLVQLLEIKTLTKEKRILPPKRNEVLGITLSKRITVLNAKLQGRT